MTKERDNHKKLGAEQLQRRKRAGGYFKLMRMRAGYTQRSLAELIGLGYYTFISQIENGQGRCPTDLYRATANALGVPVREFGMLMTLCIDPDLFDALYGDDENGAPTEADLLDSLGLIVK